jgi:hypothetical protein
MIPECKELISDHLIAEGLAFIRCLLICSLAAFSIMITIAHVVEAITGQVIYKNMPKKRKFKCWIHLTVLTIVVGGLLKSFFS